MSHETAPISLRQLTLGEVARATEVGLNSLGPDPLQHYLRDTPDSEEGDYKTRWELSMGSSLAASTRRGNVWVAGDVDALMGYISAIPVKDDADKFLDFMFPLLGKLMNLLLSKQQNKRIKQFSEKTKKVEQEVLGDAAREMVYLALLATDPPKQGHGLGSALVRHVNDFADKEGRAAWLWSSNINNTGFYNSLGYTTKATVAIGDDDSSWTEEPVIISLMVREKQNNEA